MSKSFKIFSRAEDIGIACSKTPRDLDSVFYHAQQIAENGPLDVELHVDEGGNVIGAQGRHRAIAAQQQGGPNAKVNFTIYKHPFENSP